MSSIYEDPTLKKSDRHFEVDTRAAAELQNTLESYLRPYPLKVKKDNLDVSILKLYEKSEVGHYAENL